MVESARHEDHPRLAVVLRELWEVIGGAGVAFTIISGLVVYVWTTHLSDAAQQYAELAAKIAAANVELEKIRSESHVEIERVRGESQAKTAELDRDQREYQAQAARDALERARIEAARDTEHERTNMKQTMLIEQLHKKLEDGDYIIVRPTPRGGDALPAEPAGEASGRKGRRKK